jgi:hypothetical protein
MSGYLDADAFQQASLDVAISSSNKGYKLLQMMGWKEGGWHLRRMHRCIMFLRT